MFKVIYYGTYNYSILHANWLTKLKQSAKIVEQNSNKRGFHKAMRELFMDPDCATRHKTNRSPIKSRSPIKLRSQSRNKKETHAQQLTKQRTPIKLRLRPRSMF